MQAKEIALFQFLEGNRQFIIPIYQRTYSWEESHCARLWEDILQVIREPTIKAHFIGSVVYIQQGLYQVAGMPQLLVIDGQQRLTTLTLLLTALARHIKQHPQDTTMNSEEIYDYFLINRHGKQDGRYKLLLTKRDRETMLALVDGNDPPPDPARRVQEAFDFFTEQIRTCGLTPQEIYTGIGKLILVDIALDREHDNPQLIFESLNSTGLDLSETDSIRNFILMQLTPDHQQHLYEQYWYPMEQRFGQLHSHDFDRFVRDYLTMRLRTIPRIDKIYEEFKRYYKSSAFDGSVDAVVAELYRYAKLYARLAFDGETDPALQTALLSIQEIEVNVAYPFLLEVYGDYEDGALSKEDFLAILRLVESYVFRRAICSIPTNSMNKTFAVIMRGVDKQVYRQSVEAAFLEMSSYKRFPRDDEFQREFITRDVYNFQRRNYLLERLENAQRKERVVVDGWTIEHILPQNPNLSAEWQQTLGADWQSIQNRYVHTIGNLTLTGYNSEMSDRSFPEKRDMPNGLRFSPLYLNADLGQLAGWNEATVLARAATLAQRALTIWPIPAETTPRQLAEEKKQYGLEHYAPATTAPLFEMFMRARQRILNLDASVRETRYKNGLVFRAPYHFVWMHANMKWVKFGFSAHEEKIYDPRGWCKFGMPDRTQGKSWVDFAITLPEQLDDALDLIKQSLRQQLGSEDNEDDDAITEGTMLRDDTPFEA